MLFNRYFRIKICFLKIFMLSFCIFIASSQISVAFEKGSNPDYVNKDVIKVIELLYNYEFNEAENLSSKIIEERPKDPAGYFYLAIVTWSRMAAGFWSPEVVRQYGERINRAISVARKRIQKGKADSFTYFYLGGALGFKGRFKLMQRKWLSSFFLAEEAIDALKTCLKMDPGNRDVLFGLGIFDYYTARLSGVLKFLSYLLIHKGDKKEGLRKLHIAADEATYSSIEAKSLLLHIYLFLENDYHRALLLAQELAERFKKDPRYKFLQGVAYIRLGMNSKYREVVDFFYKKESHGTLRKNGPKWEDRAIYLEASYYLFHNQYHDARSKLETILSHTDIKEDPFMTAWPFLKIGMSYDLEGEREKALKYYNQILEMKNGAGAQFLAEKYIDKPIKRRDSFLGY